MAIDASTQPGAVFGISTARVQLLTAFPGPVDQIGLTLINVNDVELYSLYIRNLTPYNGSYYKEYWQGICIKDSRNIRIGAEGKGNVISGFTADIGVDEQEEGGQIRHYCENMVIQASFVSFEPDGSTVSQFPSSACNLAMVYGKVEIGGTPEEGNLFAKGLIFSQANVYDFTDPGHEISSLPATIRISNNNIGVDHSGKVGIKGSWGLGVWCDIPGGKNTVTIEDNVISSSEYSGIDITNNERPVTIRRNFIGVDRTRTIRLPMLIFGITINASDAVTIGSNDPADANYIAYCKPVYIYPESTVAVNKNSFFCTINAYPMILTQFIGGIDPTEVAILAIKPGSVSGTATPNSSVELFYSDHCGTCSPETYFASTTADAAGNWQYNGAVNGTVIASATYNNSTSEFTFTRIDESNVAVVPACGNTGSIKGAVPLNTANVKWLDEKGNVVGTSADLINVPAGMYTLKVINGDCNAEKSYEVPQILVLNSANLSTSNPSCGKANGSARGIRATTSSASQILYSWRDAGGTEVAQTADLNNVKAGSYTLTISTADNSCSQYYGPVILKNQDGPDINQALTVVTSTLCGKSTGSVTGMLATGSGTLSYKWKDGRGLQVADTKDLLNQAAGTYFLEVTDDSGCTVSSLFISIPESNGITLSDDGIASPALCGTSNGSITGIMVTGATKYEWYDNRDILVNNAGGPSLSNAAPGEYYLVASNSGCIIKTRIYTVGILPNTTDYGLPVPQLINATCGMNNGSIRLTFSKSLPASYRWVNSSTGKTEGSGSVLQNIDAGSYQLYVADQNGCEKSLGEYTIIREAELLFNNDKTVVIADNCGLEKGSITGIQVTGKMPLSFKWTDTAGEILSSNPDITNLKAGSYQLTVTDAGGCEKTSGYTIANYSEVLPRPDVNDLQICNAGPALLLVKNSLPQYGYRLYNDAKSLVPLDERPSGQFQIELKEGRSFYVSSYSGNCESERKEVKVGVGNSSIHSPNTFTPNGDGINDTWVIRGIENYPGASVQIFNRYGLKVFESQKYQSPFDGTINGKPLPVGTYYYIINLTENCKPVSGSITILR